MSSGSHSRLTANDKRLAIRQEEISFFQAMLRLSRAAQKSRNPIERAAARCATARISRTLRDLELNEAP